MAENYSGKALILEEADSVKVFTDRNQEKHITIPKEHITFDQGDDGQAVDLGNGMPLRIVGVNFDFPDIPVPDAVCDAVITAALAVEPIRPVKVLIDAVRAQGGIGKVDTAELSQACQDKAKAFAVLAKFSILEPQAAIAFEVISKFGKCCPRFYERLLNE